jgi:anti-sigma factor RsiW
MTCPEARELIAEGLIGGELNPARQATLASHLEARTECRAESTAISALWDRLGDLPAPEPGYRL